MKYITTINDKQYEIEIDAQGNIKVNGEARSVDFLALDETLYSVITDKRSLQVVIEEDNSNYNIEVEGRMFEGHVLDERAMLLSQRRGGVGGGSGELKSPMPGLIVGVTVEIGQAVFKGQTVVILESMKMQNELKAPVDGVVQTISVQKGQTVDKGALLVIIAPPA
ncbi:MAG: acetyl-CoA carboxylase biotin carboxyl carrier protein subunit [Anaerolineae bacterium]|nr:acetyl-CoA carboxylase biotin carboxyl carrier protein subunit [Anaerolineae bacterium]